MCRASSFTQSNRQSGPEGRRLTDLEVQCQVDFRRLDERQKLVDHGQH